MKDLKDLQVGDSVHVTGGCWGSREPRIGTVIKVTPTQVTIDGGKRFTKSFGRSIGTHYYSRTYIQPVEPDKAAKLKEEYETDRLTIELVHKLNNYRWKDAPLDTLKQVVAIIQK
jgi:hypothetical protein